PEGCRRRRLPPSAETSTLQPRRSRSNMAWFDALPEAARDKAHTPVDMGRSSRSLDRIRQVPVLQLPGVVEHVPGTTSNQELQRPRPRRLTARMVVTDSIDEGIPVSAKCLGIIPRFQRNLDTDLRRELLNLGAVHV